MFYLKWSSFSFPWYWRPRLERRGGKGAGWALRWGYAYVLTGVDNL